MGRTVDSAIVFLGTFFTKKVPRISLRSKRRNAFDLKETRTLVHQPAEGEANNTPINENKKLKPSSQIICRQRLGGPLRRAEKWIAIARAMVMIGLTIGH